MVRSLLFVTIAVLVALLLATLTREQAEPVLIASTQPADLLFASTGTAPEPAPEDEPVDRAPSSSVTLPLLIVAVLALGRLGLSLLRPAPRAQCPAYGGSTCALTELRRAGRRQTGAFKPVNQPGVRHS